MVRGQKEAGGREKVDLRVRTINVTAKAPKRQHNVKQCAGDEVSREEDSQAQQGPAAMFRKCRIYEVTLQQWQSGKICLAV